jgi:hypothetical protein
MTLYRPLVAFAATCLLAASGGASATAQLGGVVSAGFVAGGGLCAKNKQVPLTTPQDTFALSLAAACVDGSSASGDLHAEAATRSIGLRVSAAGASTVAAQVGFVDQWLLSVAPGTPIGTYTIPVSFKLDGTVSAGTAPFFGSFLSYVFGTRDLYGGSAPGSALSVSDKVTATGAFSQTFAGTVNFRYFGPGSGLPLTAEVEMILFVPHLENGTIDFYNTASVSMTLPDGWSAATLSGLPLSFAPPVPEPASGELLALGLGWLVLMRAQRRPGRLALSRLPIR